MASLDQIINTTQLFQDVETSQALQQMDPQSLQRYLQHAQDSLYKDVTSKKDDAFQKAYGDLERATSTQHAIFYYNQRNQDLSNIQGQVYQDRKQNADAVLFDRDLAKRQYEINQWETGNKMDTLFVYQQLLIILSAVIVMFYLWKQSILSSAVFFGILFVLVCIFVFTIVNRAQYTNSIRDNRYWSQRQFPTYAKIKVPDVCNANKLEKGIEGDIGWAEKELETSYMSGLSDVGQDLSSLANEYNSEVASYKQDIRQERSGP